jgi:hypothetical protein
MSELIQQLAEQAKTQVTPGVDVAVWVEQYNQILGRLIIAECATVMHEQERIPAGFLYAKSADVHEMAIREHFGVE